MHIKTITIQGFKSYRDQVAVDPFSPGHNVVVGRNGSGKSNFFMAIRFVLSDAYTSLSREERQRLLHEGTSTTTTLSAFVEIVFDNRDGRFPTSLPELQLRRTIGLKKDEYSLDRKSVTKAEVMNLLESAGFSRSNPYYIVPQGRINHLTNMSDKERLNVLKEVAGTKVYEQKRIESTRIMEETNAKRSTIDGLLDTIEKRLSELETEREELKEYQEKDRERRCLEYALHQRELDDVLATMEMIEQEKCNDVHVSNEKRKEFNELEAKIHRLEEDLTISKHSLSTSSLSLQQQEAEMADLLREKTEVQCFITDFQQAGEDSEMKRKNISKQLEIVEQQVIEGSERFANLATELDRKITEEREARERLESTQSTLQVLFDKQGRSQQFSSKATRDTYLNEEIKQLNLHEQQQKRTIADLDRDTEGATDHLFDITRRAEEQVTLEESRRENLIQIGDEVAHLKVELDKMHEKRKQLWREDGKLAQSASNAKSELDSAERVLQSMMDKDTSFGLHAVRQISRRLNLRGVFGALYELFEVSDKYKTAVEVVAGTSLFHVVVDNDETASKILEVMNKEKSGRVTFIPLNRLKSVSVQYPKANDAVPMMSKLQFDRAHVMAFEQVFARTIICEDLTVAAQYTRSHGVNAVTDEGDRVDRKGALTGGFHDVRRSRLDAVRSVKRWQDTYNADAKRHAEVKENLARLEQEISHTLGQVQKLEARRKSALEDRSQKAQIVNWTHREEEQVRQRIAKLGAARLEAEAEMRATITKREALIEELKTPLRQQLSALEMQQLDLLSKNAEGQRQTLLLASQARQKVMSERNQVDIELTENLRRRQEELRSTLDDLEGDSGAGILQAGEIELRAAELRNLNHSIHVLLGQISRTEEDKILHSTKIMEIAKLLEDAQNDQIESTRAIVRIQKNTERYLAKRQTLLHRKDECDVGIRDLGVLPEEAFSKYMDMRSDKLVTRLHKVNDGLKKFAHVNKKAFEQYNNFTKQRDDLNKRHEELDESAESIRQLIETLDQRKDEAIERTFKQVSSYFEEVFEKLVPDGRGMLVMQKKINSMNEEETENMGNLIEKSAIDNYSGLAIKVSFNSKLDEGQRIQQLSGGQKSLVALATVFAIQKCDPAPFYLFDEIDANLDPQYRAAVATMIHTLSSTAQFITTTFRSEMLSQADKFYGVYFDKQKVSTIQTISSEEAHQFIETAAELTVT